MAAASRDDELGAGRCGLPELPDLHAISRCFNTAMCFMACHGEDVGVGFAMGRFTLARVARFPTLRHYGRVSAASQSLTRSPPHRFSDFCRTLSSPARLREASLAAVIRFSASLLLCFTRFTRFASPCGCLTPSPSSLRGGFTTPPLRICT
jgi:hypothetical protein